MFSHHSILELEFHKKKVQISCFSKEVQKKELVMWQADVMTMGRKETIFIY